VPNVADLEDRLRDMLDRQAALVPPPPMPLDLAQQVRQRRWRYRTRIVATAAMVVAVVVGAGIVGGTVLPVRLRGEPAGIPVRTDDTQGICTRSPSYSASPTQTVDVYFDGTRAFYDGPTQFRTGTVITFRLTGAVKEMAVAVGDLPDAVTCERAFRDASNGKFSEPPGYLTNIDWQAGDLTVTLTAGRHEVVAGTAPQPTGTDKAALAAILEVS
jgi:hypothetical protein